METHGTERQVHGNDHDRKSGTRKGFKIKVFTVQPPTLQNIAKQKVYEKIWLKKGKSKKEKGQGKLWLGVKRVIERQVKTVPIKMVWHTSPKV